MAIGAQPFLKWAGGKRQLLPEIRKYIPKYYDTYFEPFVGAGAVLFDLQPQKAVINDINFELVNTYNVIQKHVEELIEALRKHKNEKDYFYAIRDLDRSDEFKNLSMIERSARMIYLNKTCFNGLFRVNSQGQFNVPFGKYKNPKIVNEDVLRAVNHYLKANEITILNVDFETAVADAKEGDFIYFDPPYDPLSETSSFTGYSLDGFNREDQLRLRDLFVELHERGCYVLLSNSATDFIKDIYADFHIDVVSANRNINSVASKRGKIDEVLVRNYECDQ
ncbi:DNA adenine methylase [Bacillaceae bacterium YX66]